MKRVGKCLRCGRCCRARPLFKNMSKEEKMLIKKIDFKLYLKLKRLAVEDYACPFLTYKDGVAVCTIYENRPKWCREYPSNPDELLDGCGYKFIEE